LFHQADNAFLPRRFRCLNYRTYQRDSCPEARNDESIKQWDAHALLTGERFGAVKAPSGFQQNQIFEQIAG
jgi:hypothetical protein